MSGATIDQTQLLGRLEYILDSDPHINEVGFIHPSQFAALNEEVHSASSTSSRALCEQVDGIGKSEIVQASCSDSFFWHSEHKLGISTHVLVSLYTAAKCAFMEALKRYRLLSKSHLHEDVLLDGNLDTMESELMKHSKSLLLVSCDFGTAWNFRKLVVSKKQVISMFMDELLLSTLILSYAPKSERAWNHRRWVIKMIAGKCPNLQEIVERESELVKTIAENSKMNYRAWNHRCWLVSYMSGSQIIRELQSSRDWAGLHVADNSCFHYRARLLLQMVQTLQHNHGQDAFSVAEFHQTWKEELDWVGLLIKRYVGREALWLHRRFLSLLWTKHLAIDDQSTSSCCHCGTSEICDINMFIANEFELFRSCTIIPDTEFGDHQAQATHSATYILWLTKQLPLSFGVELQKSSQYAQVLRTLLDEAGKGCMWDIL